MESVRNRNVRIRELMSIAVCFLLLEVALWSPPSRQLPIGVCAFAAMTIATFTRSLPLRELGLDMSAWYRGIWIIGAAAIAAAAMLGIASLLGTLQPLESSRIAGSRSLMYGAWAFQQQFMLLSFIFVGVERTLGVWKAVSVCALLFCLAHLPNPVLCVATLFIGPLFAIAFSRYRSVYVLAIAHAILGLTLAMTVPEEMHHHMRVGWGYARYNVRMPGVSDLR